MSYLHLFSAFTGHLESIVAQGGYFFLFLVTLLEGIPLLGMLVPGHVSIIIAGFLGNVHVLDIYLVTVIVLAGAILGDFIGFQIGRHYGMSFIDRLRPYFFIRDSHIEKATLLLSRHTGKAMIIGRFSPVTRALMPFLVGTSRTSHRTFWFFNIIGAVCWTLSSLMIGYIFGEGYGAAVEYTGTFTIFAIVSSLVIVWGYYFINVRFHIFRKYELFVLILNLIALYGLSKTIQDAWAPASFMANFDVYVNAWFDAFVHLHDWLSALALQIAYVSDVIVVAGLGFVISIVLAFRHRWRSSAIMILSLASTGFALGILKEFFMRARPVNALVTLADPSFPSAHAAMITAFLVIIGYLTVRRMHSVILRELVVVACVLMAIVVGMSRVVLGVHWASDVIGGWSLGTFLATASILLIRYIAALVVKKR